MEKLRNPAITSPTQAAKALQAKVLGKERSDLLSATIFDPENTNQEVEVRVSKSKNREERILGRGTTTITATQLGFECNRPSHTLSAMKRK